MNLYFKVLRSYLVSDLALHGQGTHICSSPLWKGAICLYKLDDLWLQMRRCMVKVQIHNYGLVLFWSTPVSNSAVLATLTTLSYARAEVLFRASDTAKGSRRCSRRGVERERSSLGFTLAPMLIKVLGDVLLKRSNKKENLGLDKWKNNLSREGWHRDRYGGVLNTQEDSFTFVWMIRGKTYLCFIILPIIEYSLCNL